MKKLFVSTFSLAMLAISLGGCKGKQPKGQAPEIVKETVEIQDSTIYGVCGEGCAMHTLQLITDNGDTLNCMLEGKDGDTFVEVQGGMGIGDKVGVTIQKDSDGIIYVQTAVNITSLLGKWGSLDKTFQLNKDGSVDTNIKEPKPYTSWNLINGKLVLSPDTFEITTLGPDSLYLKSRQGVVGYRRLK